MINNVLFLEIHLGREAVQLPFHLGADATVQGHTPILECMGRQRVFRDGSYRGLENFIIRHDCSCIAWIVGAG